MVNTIFRIICWIYGHVFHRIRVVGGENIPKDSPYVLAVNHTSFRDPVALASVLKWDVSALAKKELFDSKWIGWIMRGVHAIPVDRENGDMNSLRACLNFLKEGHGLVIFPEGHRYHDGQIHEFRTGIVFIAMRANVPLIPARIHTTYRPFAKITLNVGTPIEIGRLTGSEALSSTTVRLKEAVEAL